MEFFEEYLRQGEPNKRQKAEAWSIAIGLQQVDGLKPSEYLLENAKQNIEGDITINEVKERIHNYYLTQSSRDDENRTEEADKVSSRITEILSENTFSFSPVEYLSIHKRLFEGIYPHAGKIRTYNITKPEWVLNGDTVIYGGAENLKQTLDYDFALEKAFSYKGLSQQEIIEHIAHFISYLWQIHIFGEGNTRATAVFLIKYLRKLGFKKVNNELFSTHSWYFRNALVRANYENISQDVHKTNKFLLRFLSNLILGENYPLKNREMHIHYNAINDTIGTVNSEVGTVNSDFDPVKGNIGIVNPKNDPVNMDSGTVNDLVNKKSEPLNSNYEPVNEPVFLENYHLLLLIQDNPKITREQLSEVLKVSVSTIKRRIKILKDNNIIERIGSDKTGHWKVKNT